MTSCPAGMVLIGTSGKRGAFCIDDVERGSNSWHAAKSMCNTASYTEGYAHMCTHNEWHRACVDGTPTSMTGNYEWVGDIGRSSSSDGGLAGSGSCTDMSGDSDTNTYTYRCCIN